MEHKEAQEAMKKYEDKFDFNDVQKWQILIGLREDFTPEQLALYADPKFDSRQMYEIHMGIESGLTLEQLALYADPKFDSYQMNEMRKSLRKGLAS